MSEPLQIGLEQLLSETQGQMDILLEPTPRIFWLSHWLTPETSLTELLNTWEYDLDKYNPVSTYIQLLRPTSSPSSLPEMTPNISVRLAGEVIREHLRISVSAGFVADCLTGVSVSVFDIATEQMVWVRVPGAKRDGNSACEIKRYSWGNVSSREIQWNERTILLMITFLKT